MAPTDRVYGFVHKLAIQSCKRGKRSDGGTKWDPACLASKFVRNEVWNDKSQAEKAMHEYARKRKSDSSEYMVLGVAESQVTFASKNR